MRGARTPTKVKKLQGSGNVTRELKNEVSFRPIAGTPAAPDYFGDIARVRWSELCEELRLVGLLEKTDMDSLAAYCAAVETMHTVAPTRNTDPKSFRTWRDAVDKVQSLAARFGFDPASRTRVASGKKVEQTAHPFEAALKVAK